jgi:hypothetical protein
MHVQAGYTIEIESQSHCTTWVVLDVGIKIFSNQPTNHVFFNHNHINEHQLSTNKTALF